jgi:hypothetical protein
MLEQLSVIFVSVGNPNHTWEMLTKGRTEVAKHQTMIQAAKMVRKKLAEESGRKPSQLWFEIYRTPDAEVPMHRSWNRQEMLFNE